MHDSDELDFIIDRALASYGDAGTDNDLTERMLARVQQRTHATHETVQRRWLPWVAGLAAAACALAVIFGGVWTKHAPINPQAKSLSGDSTSGSSAHALVPAPPLARPVPANRTHYPNSPARIDEQQRQEVANDAALPKLDVFPTPELVADEGRAFAFFVRRVPPSQVRELLQANANADQPVTIDDLKIPPLKPLDEGGR